MFLNFCLDPVNPVGEDITLYFPTIAASENIINSDIKSVNNRELFGSDSEEDVIKTVSNSSFTSDCPCLSIFMSSIQKFLVAMRKARKRMKDQKAKKIGSGVRRKSVKGRKKNTSCY